MMAILKKVFERLTGIFKSGDAGPQKKKYHLGKEKTTQNITNPINSPTAGGDIGEINYGSDSSNNKAGK